MKLNVSKVLTKFDGVTPLKIQSENKTAINLTVKEFLLSTLGSHQSDNGKESIHCRKLGVGIFNTETEIELTPEDVVIIKKITEKNKNWTDIVKGQISLILEELK